MSKLGIFGFHFPNAENNMVSAEDHYQKAKEAALKGDEKAAIEHLNKADRHVEGVLKSSQAIRSAFPLHQKECDCPTCLPD